jgi:hypothetical protein
MLQGSARTRQASRRVSARLWFDRYELEGMTVLEDCLNMGNGEVLVLLVLTDQRMLS